MYLIVHRTKAVMYRKLFGREYRCAEWLECSWEPRPFAVASHPGGSETIRTQSEPVEIEAPALSRIVEVLLPRNPKVEPLTPPETLRLCVPGDQWGIDPRSVLHKAEYEEDGFRIVIPVPDLGGADEPTAPAVIALSGADNRPDPQEKPVMIGKIVVTSTGYDPEGPRVDDPTLGPNAAAAAGRWGIAYGSLRPHPAFDDRSFVTKRAAARLGPLGTTTAIPEMASWASEHEAWTAFLALGLDPASPASPNHGLNHLFPKAEPIPDASYRPRCGAFELNARAEPAEETPRRKTSIAPPAIEPLETKGLPSRTKVLTGQLAFSW